MAKIITPINFAGGSEIAENSLSVNYGDLITLKSGFIDKAVAGDKVEGVAVETKTFSATNQTVEKGTLEFARTSDEFVMEIAVGNGTIAQANIGAVYNLTSAGIVDGATSASGTQLILRKVINSTLGWFVRAK